MVKLNCIYTRTGDEGTTGLVDGSRVPKHNIRMHAIGDVDEANSAIGMARSALGKGVANTSLGVIQNELFDLGADLATPYDAGVSDEIALRITAAQVTRLEDEIDGLNADLPSLDSFILPCGGAGASAVHVARAIVRRGERSATSAAGEMQINPHALAYLNRLSDFLFVLARHLNREIEAETKWVPGASR